MIGSDKRHCVLTMVDRKTGYAAIEKMIARTKEQANVAMARAIAKLCCPVKTIILDSGTEFRGFKEIERAHGIQIYFATPYHPWERGTNETPTADLAIHSQGQGYEICKPKGMR